MFGSKGKKCHFDYVNEHPKRGCGKLAEHFSVGKTAISSTTCKGTSLFSRQAIKSDELVNYHN